MPSIKEYIPGIKGGLVNFDGIRFQDVGDILDINGNEILQFDLVASAVNEITVKNAATGNAPEVQATGSDTNIDLNLVPKGTGAVKFNGAEIDSFRQKVVDTGGAYATPVVLTAAQSGRVILSDDAAGLDFTLPAIAATDTGVTFKFVVTTTVTSNALRVTGATGDLFRGGVLIMDFDTANTGSYFTPDESDDKVLSLNGSTTGGKKGSVVTFTAIHATGWYVEGLIYGDGTLATPFA